MWSFSFVQAGTRRRPWLERPIQIAVGMAFPLSTPRPPSPLHLTRMNTGTKGRYEILRVLPMATLSSRGGEALSACITPLAGTGN